MENLRLGAKIGLKWVFIPFLIILVMSHNAGAIEASDSSTVVLFGSSNPTCRYYMNGSTWSSWGNDVSPTYGINVDYSYIDTWQCRAGNSTSNFSLKGGDIVEVYWWVRDNDPISNDSYYQGSGSLQRWQYSQNWRIVSTEIVGQINNINDRYTYWRGILIVNSDITTNNITIPVQQSTTNLPNSQTSWIRTLGWTAYRAKSGTDYSTALNNIQNKIDSLNQSVQEQNEQEQEAVQDAADAAEDAANENSTNAATTNLIGVISNFISAITNFNGTDCNITLAFPSYAGGSMNVNVCQNKDKAGNIISVFTSLSLIVFYLPLAFKLLSMIYNEIRSFTNG